MDRARTCAFLIASFCFFGEFSASRGSKEDAGIHLQSLHVSCRVTSRFARTVMKTNVINKANTSLEAIFDVELPKLAFITNFSITVNGTTNYGTVKEKEAAKRKYEAAVSRGQSAGLVQSSGRKMEHFKVSVNIAASASATFELTYEELLKRHLGKYELHIKVKPNQLVEEFQVDAQIFESEGISYLEAVGSFMTNELADVIEKTVSGNKARVLFKPTLGQQQKCPGCRETLIDGELIIKYDVKRDNSAGSIKVVNGYFVHYFAPTIQQRVPKNVIFVIDRSGSMHGRKIEQTREALLKILEDISAEDHFGIIVFDDAIRKWKDSVVGANATEIAKAKKFISNLKDDGGTDINQALLAAVHMLSDAQKAKRLPEISTSLIILLTDGDPTSGVTNLKDIQRNINSAINGRYTLYCLGFGSDVNYDFLEKMALENGGLARRIYEDSDSALQLQDFYNQVANPMLLDVALQYLDNSVSDLTANRFRHYYGGSELVVAGRIDNNKLDILKATITATAVSSRLSLQAEAIVSDPKETFAEQEYIFGDYIERLWAYLTIEQLLTQRVSASADETSNLTEKALDLSLKYHFVTPLTSMVVTTFEDEEKNRQGLVADKPGEKVYADLSDTIAFAEQDYDTIAFAEQDYGHLDYGHLEYDAGPILPNIFILPLATIRTELETTPQTELETTPQTNPEEPHFLLHVPSLSRPVCLIVNEDQGTILNLISDMDSAITLNGQLIHRNSDAQTYFGKFGFIDKKNNLKVEVTTTKITVNQDEEVQEFLWTSPHPNISFLHKEGDEITVTMGIGVKFAILRHLQPELLKLHVRDSHLFSNTTSGLLGPFFSQCEIGSESNSSSTETALIVNGERMTARRHPMKKFPALLAENGYNEDGKVSATDGTCWLVHINGTGLVNRSHRSYKVSDIFDTASIQ